MKIEYVTLVNFGPYDRFEQEMSTGLIGIFGRNGSGKSTFVNGVYAALTNDFSRFAGTKADCIYDGAGPKAESYVEIEAEHEGTRFTLRRSLRPNKSVLTLVGEPAITKANEIESRLRDDLGVDMKLISTYVFVDQWEMFRFLDNTPAQRADAYKHLCGTESADDISAALATLISNNQLSTEFIDNSDELVTDIGGLIDEIVNCDALVTQYRKQQLTEKSKQTASEIIRSRERYDEAVEAQTELQEELVEIRARKVKRTAAVERLRVELAEAKGRKADLAAGRDGAVSALKSIEDYEDKKAKRKVAAKRRKKAEDALLALVSPKAPGLPEGYSSWIDLDTQISGYTYELAHNEKIVDNFENSDLECPTCGSELTEEFISNCVVRVKELQDTLSPLQAAADTYTGYLEARSGYDTAVTNAKNTIANAKATLKGLSGIDKSLDPNWDKEALEATVEAYEVTVELVDDLDEALNEKVSSLSNLTGNLDSKETENQKLTDTIAKNTVPDAKYAKVVSRLAEHDAAVLKVTEYETLSSEKTKQKQGKELELEKLRNVKQRRKKLDRIIKIAQRAREAFHWNQLPRMVAQANLVNMEADINKTLEWFGSPYWAEADENLGFKIHLPGYNSPRRAEGLSGGQKGVLAISVRVGVNSLFGTDIGMMWLDEPTAGLDEQNVDYFKEALLKLAAEVRGKRQLVVITHSDGLKSAFDQVIEIG